MNDEQYNAGNAKKLGDRATPLLHDYILDSARERGTKLALVCMGQRLTFAEIDQRSNALARALVSRGVQRGDRVVIFADNTVETVVSFWAVLKANAVVCIVNPLTKTDKLKYLLDDCRAAALITDAHIAHVFLPAARDSRHLRVTFVAGNVDDAALCVLPGLVRFDNAVAEHSRESPPGRSNLDVDLACIIYTSGSTGDPKGVMLTHRNMLTAATSVSTYLQLQESDIVLGVLPLAFDYGLYQLIMTARVGARLVLERSFTFPAQVLANVVAERVTVFPGVPTIFTILAGLKNLTAYDFTSIKKVTNTAAALQLTHIEALRSIFPDAQIYSMYGLTECKRCTYLPPQDLARKPLSVGIAIPNTELWVVDDQNRRLGPNQVGQLVIRGATVMKGYWEKPEQTAKKLRPGPLPGEFVLYTGDYCKMDEDGYLYFVSRMDDIIKSRGEKVSPAEVERAIYQIDGVKEVAVIGVPDNVLGEAVKAIVVAGDGFELSAKALQLECQKRLESFMVPKFFDIVPELPKGLTGKIQKTHLS
jgi:amino acid adenylation domain-containing protein